jgi:hypothetical protein
MGQYRPSTVQCQLLLLQNFLQFFELSSITYRELSIWAASAAIATWATSCHKGCREGKNNHGETHFGRLV